MKNLFFTLMAVIPFLMSCSQDLEDTVIEQPTLNSMTAKSMMDGLTVSDQGFLQFSDPEKYEEILHILSAYSDDELNTWEDEIGFESSYRYYSIATVNAALVEDPDTGEEIRPNSWF